MSHPPFNPSARCEKCGFDVIATKYIPEKQSIMGWNSPNPNNYTLYSEHLLRNCVRCGFTWREATVDQTKQASTNSSHVMLDSERKVE